PPIEKVVEVRRNGRASRRNRSTKTSPLSELVRVNDPTNDLLRSQDTVHTNTISVVHLLLNRIDKADRVVREARPVNNTVNNVTSNVVGSVASRLSSRATPIDTELDLA